MKRIKIQNKYLILDDDDFMRIKELINNHKFKIRSFKHSICLRSKTKLIAISRFIMNPPRNKEIDHINRNPWDNRKLNLRICSSNENARNKEKYKTNKSGFKGVSWHKGTNKWEARIRYFGKKIWIGVFTDKIEAAKAYDHYAIKLFKKFAKLNFA